MKEREMNRKKVLSQLQTFMVNIGILKGGVVVTSVEFIETGEVVPFQKAIMIVTNKSVRHSGSRMKMRGGYENE
jgi:hypothetical protein